LEVREALHSLRLKHGEKFLRFNVKKTEERFKSTKVHLNYGENYYS
jgi:hypothetical protein